MTTIHGLRRHDRLVNGIDSVAIAPYPLLRRRELFRRETRRRQRGPAIGFLHAEHDVAAVQALQVVRERANVFQNLRAGGLGIPTRLELDANGLHHAAVQKIVEIDGQVTAHRLALSPPVSTLATSAPREHGQRLRKQAAVRGFAEWRCGRRGVGRPGVTRAGCLRDDGRVTVELVAIGSELLLGQIVDSNSAWMAQRLAEVGADMFRKTTVGDNLERMVDVMGDALARAGLRDHRRRARPHGG